MKRTACALLLATVLCGSARAAAAAPDFQTPSRNIACALEGGAWLRCEILSGLRPMPTRPARCPLDWGHGLVLSARKAPAVLCAGDTVRLASMPVLAYGTTWRRGGFVCVSRFTGLTCTAPSGHGFFLSRQRWRRF
jgi:hypothetical protein